MLPKLQTSIPGPLSQEQSQGLRAYESQNITNLEGQGPIFWKRAQGSNVWDQDENRYLDLTSAFGVATLGHKNPEMIQAMQKQSECLLHGMGDIHPTLVKGALCRALSEITFERWTGQRGKVMLASAGFEAVECALKSAVMATGKHRILSFDQSYHGLGYGALLSVGLSGFSEPFQKQLAPVKEQCLYPTCEEEFHAVQMQFKSRDFSEVGAIIIEPIQGRGGKRIPYPGFLTWLREWCDQHHIALIFDEIFTGFFRTGHFFACEEEQVIPDFLCLGKALSGGFPISACVGKAEWMDAWPKSTGEAIHTSTYLGHPVGCAMACQSIALFQKKEVQETIRCCAQNLEAALMPLMSFSQVKEVRGRGLMWGVELTHSAFSALDVTGELLQRGVIALADGRNGEVLSIVPPMTLNQEECDYVVKNLIEIIESMPKVY